MAGFPGVPGISDTLAASASHAFIGMESYQGGHQYFQITAAMGTTAQLIKSVPTRLCVVFNPSATAQTGVLSIYDWNDASTYTGKTVLFQGTLAGWPSPGSYYLLQFPAKSGLVAVMSVAAAQNGVLISFI